MKQNIHHNDHDHQHHHKMMVKDFRRRFWISLIVTFPILALAPQIQSWLGLSSILAFRGDRYLLFALSTFLFFYGGFPFLKGLFSELKNKQPGMMILIALAITVAFVYSSAVIFGLHGRTFFWELATLIVVMLLGHWIEMKSVMSASSALEELAKLLPSDAHLLAEDGSLEDVNVSDLDEGDKVVIKPGEKVPVDGTVVDGRSFVDESMVTGESKPVSKSIDNTVIGGTVNGDGSLTVEVRKVGKDSYLSQVQDLVAKAQEEKSRSQTLADRAAFWLTIIALSAGVITLVVWQFIIGQDFTFSLSRMVTVMVITCPHALGLAIPLVVAVSTTLSAKNGLLIRNRTAFEQARNIKAIVFDKTGTLTEGSFKVAEVRSFSTDFDQDGILAYAASVEDRSEHPIAQAIAAASENKMKVDDFESIPGKGTKAVVEGKEIKVVSPGYIKEQGLKEYSDEVNQLEKGGRTVVYVVIDSETAGAIVLEDPVRRESRVAISKLKDMNIRVLMLTGDNKHVAQKVADELDLDDYFAEVLPEQKSDKIKKVQKDGTTTAMVGDGVNDAPALAQADVGIAIGAGTDVAVETADIVLVKNNPQDVIRLIKYSQLTRRKMIQNLFWATGYNALAIPLAAGVLISYGILLNPAVGALLMSVSTVVVAINAKLFKAPQI